MSKRANGHRRSGSGRRLATWLVAAVALSLMSVGCAGVKHLHPRTGESFRAINKAHSRGKAASLEMSGEDAELAMTNLGKKVKISDFKGNKGNFLLPLQR